jgi:hypothetical protein
MKEPKVDEGILKEIGRVIVAFGDLDFSLRCYLSGIINEKNDAVGDLIVMEFWTIDKCIDLLNTLRTCVPSVITRTWKRYWVE